MKRPPIQLSVLSAPQAPKNAPMSIMPSSPMFTTPLRSENIPPSAAKRSGVVKTSVSEMRVDHVMTSERCPALARVTETPPSIPIRPLVIASQPGRRAPSCTAQAPAATPRPPTTSGTAIERDVTGGSVTHSATMPSADARSRDVPRGHQPLREDLGVRAHSGLSRRGCSRSFLPFVHR